MAHRHMEANAAKGGDAEIGGPLTHSTDLRTSSFRNDLHNKLLAARMREMLTEDMSWKRRIFGIGPQQMQVPRSRMIHPQSPFASFIGLVSTALLLYTAIITPVLVGFFTYAPLCTRLPTQTFDMALDLYFLLEIPYTFFVGVNLHGVYCDEYRVVGWHYLKTHFLFDCGTSIPVSWVEWYSQQQCLSDPDAEDSQTQALKIIRVIKPLRLFKLLRVLKAIKLLSMIDDFESYLRLPPFMFRMLRIVFIILYSVHFTACGFWLVKEYTNTHEEMDEWLDSLLPYPDTQKEDMMHKYIIAFYFINTIFATVGFGDITPINSSERLYVVFTFYLGTLVFGTLLAEVENALAQLRQTERLKGRTLQTMRDFLRRYDVPRDLEKNVMQWIDFDVGHKITHTGKVRALESLPPSLQQEVIAVLHKGVLKNISLFKELDHPVAEPFILDIYKLLDARTFAPICHVAVEGEPVDGLYIVSEGSASVWVHAADGQEVDLLHLNCGDSFGEFSLLGHKLGPTAVGTCWDCSISSLTYLMCLFMSKEAFSELLSVWPQDLQEKLMEVHKAKSCDKFQEIYKSTLHHQEADTTNLKLNQVEERWRDLVMRLNTNLVKRRNADLWDPFATQVMNKSSDQEDDEEGIRESGRKDAVVMEGGGRPENPALTDHAPNRPNHSSDYTNGAWNNTSDDDHDDSEEALMKRMQVLSIQIRTLSAATSALAAAVHSSSKDASRGEVGGQPKAFRSFSFIQEGSSNGNGTTGRELRYGRSVGRNLTSSDTRGEY